MALLAVVDALEHAIFTAVAAKSTADATHGTEKRGKNQPATYAPSMKRIKKWEGILEPLVTGEIDCDVWCGGGRAGGGEEGRWRARRQRVSPDKGARERGG